jgi:hypothetical protein
VFYYTCLLSPITCIVMCNNSFMYGSKHVLTQAKLVRSSLPNLIKNVQH